MRSAEGPPRGPRLRGVGGFGAVQADYLPGGRPIGPVSLGIAFARPLHILVVLLPPTFLKVGGGIPLSAFYTLSDTG